MIPTVDLGDGRTRGISYEIGPDGTLVLPRRDVAPTLRWRVEAHRGPAEVDVAVAGGLAGVSHAPAADLLAWWGRAEKVLEPLLLAVARAVAAGVELDEAARQPARVEPAPGILVIPLRTPTLAPATHTNCVLAGDALVEPATPYEDELERLCELLRDRKPQALLLTHHHGDHIGAAEQLRQRLRLPLCAHRETARRVPVKIDREIEDGEEVFGLRALFTPGHAPGHLCFLEPRTRTLMAGDMVAGEGTILVSRQDDGDMKVYLESLARLAAMDLHVVVPAHGPPIARPRDLFEHYIGHRLMRERRVVDALARGPARAGELLPTVYDDTPRAVWPIAAISLDAHLHKLLADGRVRREGERWQLSEARDG